MTFVSYKGPDYWTQILCCPLMYHFFPLVLRVPILATVQRENFPLLNLPTFTSLTVANDIVKAVDKLSTKLVKATWPRLKYFFFFVFLMCFLGSVMLAGLCTFCWTGH